MAGSILAVMHATLTAGSLQIKICTSADAWSESEMLMWVRAADIALWNKHNSNLDGLELEREELTFYLDGWFVHIEEDTVRIYRAINGRMCGQEEERGAKTISCEDLARLAKARCELQGGNGTRITFKNNVAFVDDVPLTEYVPENWKQDDAPSAWLTSVYRDIMGDD